MASDPPKAGKKARRKQWTNLLKDFVPGEWHWIAWSVSGDNAAEAHRLLSEVPLIRLVEFYAIKVYQEGYSME